MHAYRSNYAFFTNGEQVVLFVRLGRTSLCVSDVMDWDDPDVLEALIGLTFASIDYPSRSWAETTEPTEEMQDSYKRSRDFIFKNLCPVHELVLDWSGPGEKLKRKALSAEVKTLLAQDAAPAVLPELAPPREPHPEVPQGPILIPLGQTRGEGKRRVKPTTRRNFEFNKDSEVTKRGDLRFKVNAPRARSERRGQPETGGGNDNSSREPDQDMPGDEDDDSSSSGN